jgi:hypothetical protein
MIMHGIETDAEGKYGALIEIMRYMKWGWRELMEAPAALVEEIAFRMAQENRWTHEARKLNEAMG